MDKPIVLNRFWKGLKQYRSINLVSKHSAYFLCFRGERHHFFAFSLCVRAMDVLCLESACSVSKITAPCYFPLSFHLFVFFFGTSRKQIKFLTCISIAEDFCLKNKFTSSFVTRLGVHFILNAIFKLLRTRQFPYVQMIKFNRFHIVKRFLHSWIV